MARCSARPLRSGSCSRCTISVLTWSLSRPDLDAHKRDPLGGLRLVEADYLWATEALAKVAHTHCHGRIVSMLEGGYDLEALAKSVGVHVRTLMDVGA